MLKPYQNDDNTNPPEENAKSAPPDSPDWATEPELAARHLAAHLTEPQVCGAILFAPGEGSLSYAGELIQSSAEQISAAMESFWGAEPRGEIARYLTLQPGEVDYLLFALPFTAEFVLAVLFEPDYPLSQVRSYGKKLAQDLLHTAPPAAPPPPAAADALPAEEDYYLEEFDIDGEEGEDFPEIDLTDLLSHMPPPDPENKPLGEQKATEGGDVFIEEAILNDPAAIPAFLVPPFEETETPESVLSAFSAQQAGEADEEDDLALSQDGEHPLDPFSLLFDSGETSGSPFPTEAISALEFGEESSTPESSSSVLQDSPPEPHTDDRGNMPGEEEELLDESFSLEKNLSLPWETEEEVSSAAAGEESPVEPEGAPEWETPTESTAEEKRAEGIESVGEGIPLPEDGSGWLAPFLEKNLSERESSSEGSTHAIWSDFEDSEGNTAEEIDESLPELEANVEAPPSIEIPAAPRFTKDASPDEPAGELPDSTLPDTHPTWLYPADRFDSEESEEEAQEKEEPCAYTCVLVPNLPENILAGLLAKKLGEWLGELSESFGVHLDRITLRPSYLQWMIEVPHTVSTASLVHSIRIHTSQRIYDHFPELKHRSPEDFWAPSQLIISGEHSPSAEMVESFIQKSRQHG